MNLMLSVWILISPARVSFFYLTVLDNLFCPFDGCCIVYASNLNVPENRGTAYMRNFDINCDKSLIFDGQF